ncbi:MAG: hypothetical protein WB975_15060 [Nitrososphaeraceae archaeon]
MGNWSGFSFTYSRIFPFRRIGGFVVTGMAVLILISSSINIVYSQSLNDVFSSSDLTTWIKILEPVKGQTMEIGEAVEVRGEVSAGISKDCHIFVIVNNVKSSQNSV